MSAVVNALWNVLSYLVEAYIAGDEIEAGRILQEVVYGAICGVIGGMKPGIIKIATNILLDATNNLIKQIVFEKKQYSHKMLGLACLDAVENQLVSILWNHKCGEWCYVKI